MVVVGPVIVVDYHYCRLNLFESSTVDTAVDYVAMCHCIEVTLVFCWKVVET